ncbi:MAG: twin-arginine translocation signal domain-containing protein [Chloroflexi bacterium]|nr:twin-arginine translocation signal domain-containing protein [Chloroflexota bacterium]
MTAGATSSAIPAPQGPGARASESSRSESATSHGVTRRDFLKKAGIGAAVVVGGMAIGRTLAKRGGKAAPKALANPSGFDEDSAFYPRQDALERMQQREGQNDQANAGSCGIGIDPLTHRCCL